MIDVHAPHETVHTWRDFFIHIATIVVGLLIAIGLEQSVEYFHHRHLAKEARELLRAERISNERSNELNIYTTHHHQRDLHRDLSILHAVRAHAPLPGGPFILQHPRFLYMELEWRKIHESGTINYLTGNLSAADYRYENQDAFMARAALSIEDLSRAGAVLRSENDPLQATMEDNVANSNFLNSIADSHHTLSEQAVNRGYARFAETANLATLSPSQIDALEKAVQVALVDDDALLTYCYNIKRNLARNPAL